MRSWRVRDLTGKYSFSNGVIFNENITGHLGVPHSLVSPSSNVSLLPPPHPSHDHLCLCTAAGQAFNNVICLKQFQNKEQCHTKVTAVAKPVGVFEDVPVVDAVGVHGGDPAAGAMYGGVIVCDAAVDVFLGGP